MTVSSHQSAGRRVAFPARVADASATLGGLAWLGIVLAGVFGPVRDVIALAMLVLVPLALRLADAPRRDGTRPTWYRLAAFGQPVAAVPGVLSLTVDPGVTAVLLALPWALATVAVAGFGAWRLLGRGPWPLEELAVDAGLLYVAVGGGALVLDRAGIALVFQPILVTLTVVHFHYAGSALPILAGLAGRYAPGGRVGTVLRATTGIVIVGPAIIAVGITAAALALPLAGVVEFTAVAFFTTAVALFALAVLAGVLPQVPGWPQRVLLGVASLAVPGSMGLAVLYGLARATGGTYLGIHAGSFGPMVTYHGQINAYAFALPALVGWRLAVPAARARPPGIAFSSLRAGWSVGADFLDRRGVTTDADVAGMMDDVDAFTHDGFDPDAVDDAVRRFFERSGEYELAVDPDWAPPWRWLARASRAVTTRVDQLSVPLAAAEGEAALTGRVVGVDVGDEHTGDRAWIRSNAVAVGDDRQMTYVGVYDRYVSDGIPYLRVAFPLSGSNLTGILRVENGGSRANGLVLSSYPVAGNADDAGLYLVVGGFGVRIPLNERFVLEPDPDREDAVTAVHRVTALGLPVFTLDYAIEPASSATDGRVTRNPDTGDPGG